MKNINLYSIIVIGIFILSMFLLYEVHDVYSGGSWSAKGTLIQENVPSVGANYMEVYGVLFFLIFIMLINLIKRNFIMALFSSILGFLSLLSIPFLYFTLVFTFFGPNNRIGFGLVLAYIIVCFYAVILLLNVLSEFRKKERNHEGLTDDLIDSNF